MEKKSSPSRHVFGRVARPSLEAPPADLLIVGRGRQLLYRTFLQMSVDEHIEVRMDQRRRPGPALSPTQERRRRDINMALRTTGWVMIPGSARTPARDPDRAT